MKLGLISCVALSIAGSAPADLSDWVVAVGIGTAPTYSATQVAVPDEVDIGPIAAAGGATYEFVVNATNMGVSSALMGAINTGVGLEGALKFEQYPDTTQFGVTAWSIADYTLSSNAESVDLHLVFVSDIQGSQCDLYVDGVLTASAPYGPWLTGLVGIGHIYGPGSSFDTLNGTLLGVATYDTRLSAAEIADHATAFLKGGLPLGTSYCVSTLNSTAAAARISAFGNADVSLNYLILEAAPVPDQPGIFYYGAAQVLVPFGNGFRCVGVAGSIGVQRLAIELASGNVLSHTPDLTNPPTSVGLISAGSTWYFQAWFRDPAGGGASFNLSDGVGITFR